MVGGHTSLGSVGQKIGTVQVRAVEEGIVARDEPTQARLVGARAESKQPAFVMISAGEADPVCDGRAR
jgi:hypothetical protein